METNKQLFAEPEHLHSVGFSPVRQVMEKMRTLERQGHQVIPFQIGEPDFDTPRCIVEATKQALDAKFTHYAPNRGSVEFRKAIGQLLFQKGLQYDPETEILVTVGGAEAIFDGVFAFLDKGDEVIVPTPSFMNYRNDIAMAGGRFVELPLRAEDSFQINITALKQAITPKTKMLIINNPSNPTGIIFTPDVLKQVAKIAVRYNLIVFSDEIYDEIVYDGTPCVSIATFPGMRERTIVMNGFSKSFAMTGWRVGYLAAPPSVITTMLKVHQYVSTCIPTFIQEGLASSMLSAECQADRRAMVAAFSRKRKLLLEGLSTIPQLRFPYLMGRFMFL